MAAFVCPVLMDEKMLGGRLLRPSKLSVQRELYSVGTASMLLPEGEPTVGFRAWVRLCLPNKGERSEPSARNSAQPNEARSLRLEDAGRSGECEYYRVKSAPMDCGKEQKVQLTHGICTLNDEVTQQKTTLEGTAREILTALLGCQRTARWQLGVVEKNGNFSVEVNGETVQRAFFDAIERFGDCYPEYDFTTSPWTIHLRNISQIPGCECRLRRNISGVKVDYDDSAFCTRIVSPLLPGGELVADSAGRWGIISHRLDAGENASAAEVLEEAQRLLARHSQPAIYAEVSALELVRQTGEELDCFVPGYVCRCALPDYGITVEKPIVSLRYDDLVRNPESVRLSLGQKIKDAGQKLGTLSSDLRRGMGGLGGRIKDAENTLILQEESLITLSAWSRTAEGALMAASVRIDGINAQVQLKASQEAVDGLSSRVSQAEIAVDGAAAAILLKADQTSVNALGSRVTTAEIAIDGANAAIALKVSKDGVISSINQTAESVTINASKINLSGYVTASQLSATNASISNITNGMTTAVVMKSVLFSGGNFDGNTVTASIINFTGARFGGKLVQRRSLTVSTPSGSETINYLGYVP